MPNNDAAQDSSARPLTRRQWLSHVSIPAFAATAMTLGAGEARAQSSMESSPSSDIGAHLYNIRSTRHVCYVGRAYTRQALPVRRRSSKSGGRR